MRISGIILFLLVLPLPLYALTLAGTGDSETLLRRLAAVYMHQHPETRIEIPPSVGSSGGIRLLLQGRTDLARVARSLTASEENQGLRWGQYAQSPVVFVANLPQPCVRNLDSDQVLEIFGGRITRWSQLGNCPDEKIFLIRREAGDSSNRALEAEIFGFKELQETAGTTVYTTPETLEILQRYPYTMGYLPLSEVLETALLRFRFNGHSAERPGDEGRYPLVVPMALVWKESLSAEGREFLQFLNDDQAIRVIRTLGAVPLPLQVH